MFECAHLLPTRDSFSANHAKTSYYHPYLLSLLYLLDYCYS